MVSQIISFKICQWFSDCWRQCFMAQIVVRKRYYESLRCNVVMTYANKNNLYYTSNGLLNKFCSLHCRHRDWKHTRYSLGLLGRPGFGAVSVAVFRLAIRATRGRAAVGAADGRARARLGAAAIPRRGAGRFSLHSYDYSSVSPIQC